MKPSEAEVRAHRDDLKAIIESGACRYELGEKVMLSHLRLLTWVLDGDPEIEAIVRITREDAIQLRRREPNETH